MKKERQSQIRAALDNMAARLDQRPVKAGPQVLTVVLLEKISDQLERQNELLERLAQHPNHTE